MIVAELIDLLKRERQDLRVVIRGYEYGQTDVNFVERTGLYLNYHGEKPEWGGPHEVKRPDESVESGFQIVDAVRIAWRGDGD